MSIPIRRIFMVATTTRKRAVTTMSGRSITIGIRGGCSVVAANHSRRGLEQQPQQQQPPRFFSSSPARGVTTANIGNGNSNNMDQMNSSIGKQQQQQQQQQRVMADPMAKRPNKLCDPYGQGGRPMSMEEAQMLKKTIHDDWRIESTTTTTTTASSESSSSEPAAPAAAALLYLVRDFHHNDYLYGARFLAKIAAVAQINNHFPSLTLDRKIVQKNWHAYTRVTCHTKVLRGLSQHDFHLAMVRTYRTPCLYEFFFVELYFGIAVDRSSSWWPCVESTFVTADLSFLDGFVASSFVSLAVPR
jgi:pterin-4a-carbinolamine dehydratase